MQRNHNSKKYEKLIIIIAIAVTALLIIVINLVGSPMNKKEPAKLEKNKATVSADINKSTGTTVTTAVTETTTARPEETTVTVVETSTSLGNDINTGTNPQNAAAAERLERNANKKVYLTFDDGPSENTNRILDILDKYDVKATFFNMHTDSPELLAAQKREYEEGHTIAIHTVDHRYEDLYASFDAWKNDIMGEHDFLKEQLGIDVRYYRFPGGSSNTLAARYGTNIDDCISWLGDNGFKYFDWNSENGDGRGRAGSPELCLKNINAAISDDGDGYIVLMHDAAYKDTTVEALPAVIENLKGRGFTLCQITDNTIPVHHR